MRLFILFLFVTNILCAQTQPSLNDTNACNVLVKKIENEQDEQIWILYNKELQTICLTQLTQSNLSLLLQQNYQKNYATSLANEALYNDYAGNIKKALELNFKALSIYEKLNLPYEISVAYNNIGYLYNEINELNNALTYYTKIYQIKEQLKNNNDIAQALNNIGTVYTKKNKNKEALSYFERALALYQQEKNVANVAIMYNNIGKVYEKENQLQKALNSYKKSYELKLQTNNVSTLNLVLINISKTYYLLHQPDSALYYAKQAEQKIQTLNRVSDAKDVYKLLYTIYKQQNLPNLALSYHEKFITMRDSINNDESRKASMKSQIQYDYDKQTIADSIAFVKQTEIKNAELKQQQAELKTKRQQQYALFGGLALVLVFAGVMYNRFKVTQKQKHIIELKEQETQQQNVIITEQKKLVEHKHQEITDSINYAERIQRSFMATKDLLNANLETEVLEVPSNHFVFFRPKDVVSGDFYWAKTLAPTLGGGGGLRKQALHFLSPPPIAQGMACPALL